MRIFLPLLLAMAVAAPSQARELYWKNLDVEARLDNDGRLHVVERQHYVFNGDWNGGERRFNLRTGQDLELVRISRVDNGNVIDMQEGDLESVGNYGWSENRTLRWRSRAPADPPFENTELIYEIEYRLSNILQTKEKDGETIYVLDHDFAFADRDGRIEKFTLQLELDGAWRPLSTIQPTYSAGPLPPGTSFPMDVEMAYAVEGVPGAVKQRAPLLVRQGVLVGTSGAVLAMLLSFFSLERSRRRFEREEIGTINTAWLEKNVFFAPPEVVGALWDVDTGAAEVAAIMARLAQEKKLETTVKPGGWLSSPSLEMTLLVPRQQFSDSERPLIDAFFIDGDFTSTDKIREHYRSTGFNPSSVIKPALEAAIGANPAWKDQKLPRNWWRDILLVLAAFGALVVAASTQGEEDIIGAVVIGVSSVITLMIGSPIAYASRNAIGTLKAWTFGFTFLTILQIVALAAIGFAGQFKIASVTYIAMGLAIAIVYWFVIGFAPFTESLERLAVRRRLRAARTFFERELRKPQPALRDEWFPYIMAFGLGRNVDKWFSSFGGASSSIASSRSSSGSFGSSGSVSSGGPSGSWSGGGTSFGGAGATGAWAVAAGGLAAGVAAPSSSGSSGGGGGGSSSGGGGGGGW